MKPVSESRSLKIAKLAQTLMAERGIEPNPVNFSVWYHYIAGDRKDLKQEMEQLLNKKELRITDDVNIYLYNKYVVPDSHVREKALEVSSQNAQNVLTEIMQVIEKFTGETANYSQEIDTHVTELSEKITDPALKALAKEIVSRAVAIRDSSSALGSKLEESKREVIHLKTTLEKVTSEANRDFLTNVGNRKSLELKLEELTQWAKEKHADLCLLMIDIDHFKSFNDKYGHLVGDEVLRKVGTALVESVKGKDFVARYGGEEFAVLLPSTPLMGALAVAEILRKNIADTDLVRKDTGASIGLVTVSIGVARYRADADSIAMFISRADDALYRSKIGGRNRVTQESFDKTPVEKNF